MRSIILFVSLIAGINTILKSQSNSLTVPTSLAIQLKTHSCSTDDINDVKKLGVGYVRRGFIWENIEKEKGVYDFSDYDRLMNDIKSSGLKVLGCLFGNNKLYEDDGQGGIQTEEGRKGFANFSAALASRYKEYDIVWEIWNEPNIRTFWRKNGMHNTDEFADEYTALVKEIVPAMKKANPLCIVMAGSVSNLWEPSYFWTEACIKKGIFDSGIDAWSVHPYGFKTPEEHAIGYERIRTIFVNNGIQNDFPLFNSERGFSIEELHEGWSGGDKAMAQEYQAWHFVRQYMIDLMYNIQLSVWYEWKGKSFGLKTEGETRLSYNACKTMINQLSGYKYVKKLKSNSEHDFILLFENEFGKQKLVVWTSPKPNETPDKAIPHSIEIPVKSKSKIAVVDLYGKKSFIEIKDGRIEIDCLPSPQYVNL